MCLIRDGYYVSWSYPLIKVFVKLKVLSQRMLFTCIHFGIKETLQRSVGWAVFFIIHFIWYGCCNVLQSFVLQGISNGHPPPPPPSSVHWKMQMVSTESLCLVLLFLGVVLRCRWEEWVFMTAILTSMSQCGYWHLLLKGVHVLALDCPCCLWLILI